MGGELQRREYPDREECLHILEKHRVPPHIKVHSAVVAGIAKKLSEALRACGKSADFVDLAVAGALLNDIAKADSIEAGFDHAAEGGRILRLLGFPAVAEIVERHVDIGDWHRDGPVTVAEIVNYSDKRVKHESIVSLEERFSDLITRYSGKHRWIEAGIRKNWETLLAVEEKIFRPLPFGPNDIHGT